ncbi:hypothetical protein AJ79_02863 [Helicocarpus griseus UAMH5409]|uniref:Rhodanese domain-containing protein n=1 Tax=Helicocarpus griseus UAMH5409 TaxID=1447875 RepID=A0A2B7Y1V4_9EURO|nr:hypothetical protein AJ79_02863 [Helicocarpus griseus UAMH5409]
MAAPVPAQEIPWHAAFPAPKTTAASIPRSEVLGWLNDESRKGTPVDFVLVDLRRADHEGGTISTSINLPAQSLYPSLPTLYAIFKQAGIKKVIFYCGSSRGRGTRAGGWFADYILEKEGEGAGGMQSLVLEGGIKGWVAAGEEYVNKMEGYDASIWATAG